MKLTQKQRDALPASDFGLPDTREYPMPDAEHVRKAVQMFGYCPKDKRESLAKKIVDKAKEFDIDWTKWEGVKKYLSKSYIESDAPDPIFDYFQEASRATKERRNMDKNLKKMGFNPDEGTVNYGDGNARFTINGRQKNCVHWDPFASWDSDNTTINLTGKTMKQHPKYAQTIFQHEASHAKDQSYRYENELETQAEFDATLTGRDAFIHGEAVKFIEKHRSELSAHDQKPNELRADVRSAEKNGYNRAIETLSNIANHFLEAKAFNEECAKLVKMFELATRNREFAREINGNKFKELREMSSTLRKRIDRLKKAPVDLPEDECILNDKRLEKALHRYEMTKELMDELYRQIHSVNPDKSSDKEYFDENRIGEARKRILAAKKNIDEFDRTYLNKAYRTTMLRTQFLREMKHKLAAYDRNARRNPNYKDPRAIKKG